MSQLSCLTCSFTASLVFWFSSGVRWVLWPQRFSLPPWCGAGAMMTPLVSTFGEFCPYVPSSLLIIWTVFPRPSSTVVFTVALTYSSDTMFLSERAADTEQRKSRTTARNNGTGRRFHRGDVISSFQSSLHPSCRKQNQTSSEQKPVQSLLSSTCL